MQRWEYVRILAAFELSDKRKIVDGQPLTKAARVMSISGTYYSVDRGLQVLGENGWELVAIYPSSIPGSSDGAQYDFWYVFKRPK